ncbi:MAG: hypothetical protein AAGJ35_11950, partial [Myxococcota bacterium]
QAKPSQAKPSHVNRPITANESMSTGTNEKARHAARAVRHDEKCRTGTCRFANRVATASIACFRHTVPTELQEEQKQMCIATIVAHFVDDGLFQVMGLGVGTKFLSADLLRAEKEERGERVQSQQSNDEGTMKEQ